MFSNSSALGDDATNIDIKGPSKSISRKRSYCEDIMNEVGDIDDLENNTQKRANFSALSQNGVFRTNPVTVSKPGITKKLIIKNFRGEYFMIEIEIY